MLTKHKKEPQVNNMIVRASYIDIDYEELESFANKWKITEVIRKRLIQQDNIDINYYDIIINKITWFEVTGLNKFRVYIGYILKQNSSWDALEEVKERLKTGL